MSFDIAYNIVVFCRNTDTTRDGHYNFFLFRWLIVDHREVEFNCFYKVMACFYVCQWLYLVIYLLHKEVKYTLNKMIKGICIFVLHGIKVRLYPTESQAQVINNTIGACRFVYKDFLRPK